jgi:methionyl aminopeptidase
MIRLKNQKQMDGIRESCRMLKTMFSELVPLVAVGVETRDLDRWVRDWIKKAGGKPAFLGYGDDRNPYPAALCVSINDEVIHGIPSKRRIADGDLVSLDCGIDLGGHFSDMARTVPVGNASEEARKLVRVTEECLALGLAEAKSGNRIHQISRAVFNHAKEHGYGVVHQYCGHGVGFSPHEDPQVPNYVSPGANPRMAEGLVIAIEPMINIGTGDVELLEDDWTVVTADGKLSSHCEHTVAIFRDRTEILTA